MAKTEEARPPPRQYEDNFRDHVLLQVLVAESEKFKEAETELILPTEPRILEREIGAWENRPDFSIYKESLSTTLSVASTPREHIANRPVAPAGRSVGVVYLAHEDKEKAVHSTLKSPRRRSSIEHIVTLSRADSESSANLKLPQIDGVCKAATEASEIWVSNQHLPGQHQQLRKQLHGVHSESAVTQIRKISNGHVAPLVLQPTANRLRRELGDDEE